MNGDEKKPGAEFPQKLVLHFEPDARTSAPSGHYVPRMTSGHGIGMSPGDERLEAIYELKEVFTVKVQLNVAPNRDASQNALKRPLPREVQ